MSNILVTGGAGFMGSHFIKRIIRSSFNEIVCVDKLTYAGNMRNLESGISRKYDFFQEDINNILMEQIIKDFEIDIVVNFAAETHVDRSIKNPKAFLETDIMGLFNLVQCCMKQKIKKFVHISTDEVYGSIPSLGSINTMYSDSDKLIKGLEATEGWSLDPTSPYSTSKACADLLLLSYYKTYGFPVVIARPCNNYGPNQYPEKLIPMAITRLMQSEKVLLHGEGNEIREWLYVGDCVRVIERIMNDGRIGEIYNVGSGQRLTNYEVIEKVISHFKDEYESDINYIEKVPNRPGNDNRYAINSDKAREAFRDGISRTPFSIGLNETIEWYMANPDYFGKVNLDDNLHIEGEGYLR